MAFNLATLFVDIKARDDDLKTQVGGVQRQLGAMGVAIGTAAGNLLAGAIRGGADMLGNFIKAGVSGAVELEDSMSAIGVIFGQNSGIITAASDEMARKFGVVKGEFINAASGFGAAFKGAGASQEEAATIGTKLAKLGMDMASFTAGATNQEAFTALQAALRGEFDPLERFNVFLSAAKIESEALSSGLAKTKGEIDDHAKKQATLNLIMAGTKDQQGDLARTADSSKNAWSNFTGTMTNLSVTLATGFTPVIKEVTSAAVSLGDALTGGVEGAQSGFGGFIEGLAEGVRTAVFAVENFGDIWELMMLPVATWGDNVTSVLQAVGENVVNIARYIGTNWYQLITDALSAVSTSFTNFGENVSNLGTSLGEFFANPMGGFSFSWKPLLEGFSATAEAMPALVMPKFEEMGRRREEIEARIGARETARIEQAARLKGDKAQASAEMEFMRDFLGLGEEDMAGAPGKKGKVAKEKEFKSETLDTADFSRKMRESIFGGDDTAKAQLKAQQETAAASKEIAANTKKKGMAVLA